MFAQIAITLLGLFLITTGLREADYVDASIGALVSAFAIFTLYRLKTGK